MSKTGTSLSELMTIRDILMGEIIDEYNTRIEALEQKVEEQNKALEVRDAALNARIIELSQVIEQKQDELSINTEDTRNADRERLAAMFLSLGHELKNG